MHFFPCFTALTPSILIAVLTFIPFAGGNNFWQDIASSFWFHGKLEQIRVVFVDVVVLGELGSNKFENCIDINTCVSIPTRPACWECEAVQR